MSFKILKFSNRPSDFFPSNLLYCFLSRLHFGAGEELDNQFLEIGPKTMIFQKYVLWMARRIHFGIIHKYRGGVLLVTILFFSAAAAEN
jgi:hypothetical protein